jgi:hypothetical protein
MFHDSSKLRLKFEGLDPNLELEYSKIYLKKSPDFLDILTNLITVEISDKPIENQANLSMSRSHSKNTKSFKLHREDSKRRRQSQMDGNPNLLLELINNPGAN